MASKYQLKDSSLYIKGTNILKRKDYCLRAYKSEKSLMNQGDQ